jgi:hypothetical protein
MAFSSWGDCTLWGGLATQMQKGNGRYGWCFVDFCFFWWDWSLNLGLHTCKASALSLEPHLQSILLWLFWTWGLENYLPRLASNHDPTDISLPSSEDTGVSHWHPAMVIDYNSGGKFLIWFTLHCSFSTCWLEVQCKAQPSFSLTAVFISYLFIRVLFILWVIIHLCHCWFCCPRGSSVSWLLPLLSSFLSLVPPKPLNQPFLQRALLFFRNVT